MLLIFAMTAIVQMFSVSRDFQHSFVIGGDSNRSITNMVVSGTGVWLSLQNSAVLRLIHSLTYEVLAEVNTALAVTKMLSSKSSSRVARGRQVPLGGFAVCDAFRFCCFRFRRLRRHHTATQSSVSPGHVVAGGQRPPVDRHECGCRLDHDHSGCRREHRQARHSSRSDRYINSAVTM